MDRDAILDTLRAHLKEDPYWSGRLGSAEMSQSLHVAVFQEPYLSFVLSGRKTVESRFSVNGCAPFRRVQRGDIMLLKAAGGAVTGLCSIGGLRDYVLDPTAWEEVRALSDAICVATPSFWTERANARYATLIWVTHARRLPPLFVPKRDRRGWVILPPATSLFRHA